MALLEVNNLDAGYGFLQVLWDVSLTVSEGEFVALIGPNGAGKSTTLKAIAGLISPQKGQINFNKQSVVGIPAFEISNMGVSFISENLNLFTNMSVYENLLLGAYVIPDKDEVADLMDFVFKLFPRLEARRYQLAGTLSGGERKMLAIGRGIMSKPSLLLVDEPSLGLAPMLTLDVFRALETLRTNGMTVLLVEQNVNTTLRITDRAYVMEQGQITLAGNSKELLNNEHVRQAYLGV
jgi:branched-chain amino acid transport system ATP-binding protein